MVFLHRWWLFAGILWSKAFVSVRIRSVSLSHSPNKRKILQSYLTFLCQSLSATEVIFVHRFVVGPCLQVFCGGLSALKCCAEVSIGVTEKRRFLAFGERRCFWAFGVVNRKAVQEAINNGNFRFWMFSHYDLWSGSFATNRYQLNISYDPWSRNNKVICGLQCFRDI